MKAAGAGECWLGERWGVLVLRVEALAPESVRARYKRAVSASTAALAEEPHAWCLVLYDDEGCWAEGSTRWVELRYLRRNCERLER